MYRSLTFRLAAITVMLAATVSTLAAQRGFHGGGGSVFRGTPAVRSAPGPAFIGRPVAPFVTSPVTPFVTSPFAPPVRVAPFGVGRFPRPIGRFPRTIVVPPVIGFGYYSPYAWPTQYAAPPYYGSYDPGYASQAAPAPVVSQGDVDLAYQVGRLSEEIQQLRQQQAQPPVQQAPIPTQSALPVPTMLVFRDGHRMEVQNYAIIGQTLWVLDEYISTKISVSDLDLDATQTENRSRGLRFPLPQK
jgi:hypothetical protein